MIGVNRVLEGQREIKQIQNLIPPRVMAFFFGILRDKQIVLPFCVVDVLDRTITCGGLKVRRFAERVSAAEFRNQVLETNRIRAKRRQRENQNVLFMRKPKKIAPERPIFLQIKRGLTGREDDGVNLRLLRGGIELGEIVVRDQRRAVCVHDLQWEHGARNATKTGAQDFMPLNYLMQRTCEPFPIQQSIQPHYVLRAICNVLIPLLEQPDALLLKRQPKTFDRLLLHWVNS